MSLLPSVAGSIGSLISLGSIPSVATVCNITCSSASAYTIYHCTGALDTQHEIVSDKICTAPRDTSGPYLLPVSSNGVCKRPDTFFPRKSRLHQIDAAREPVNLPENPVISVLASNRVCVLVYAFSSLIYRFDVDGMDKKETSEWVEIDVPRINASPCVGVLSIESGVVFAQQDSVVSYTWDSSKSLSCNGMCLYGLTFGFSFF